MARARGIVEGRRSVERGQQSRTGRDGSVRTERQLGYAWRGRM
jgi:hypothetical protein